VEENLSTCMIYEQERPMRCSIYPDGPPIIHPDCGYYFVDTWEDNKIVKRIL